MRKLASIQTIINIEPIKDADKIEYASVLGWHCVVKKNEFKVGDKCVYIEIDSILPSDNPNFDFMKDRKYRVKTIKLRGKVSQGIIFPMSILPKDESKYSVGDDVTAILKIKKYEPEDVVLPSPTIKKSWLYYHTPNWIRGILFRLCPNFAKKIFKLPESNKPFPYFVPKSDETRCQSFTSEFYQDHIGQYFSYTEKEDGCVDGTTALITTEGRINISDIVNNERKVQVLTYNEELKCVEFKPILKYHKYQRTKPMYSINCSMRGHGNRAKYIKCTNDHMFYTDRGWVQADQLTLTDTVYHFNETINFEVQQVLLGCCLGDSYIYSKDNYIKVTFNHSEDQYEYLDYKAKLLGNNYIESTPHHGGYEGSKVIRRGITRSTVGLNQFIREYCLKDDKRYINEKWMNELTPIAIAFWYMDDGTLNPGSNNQRPRMIFNTQRYTLDEVSMFVEMFSKKFNIRVNIGDKDKYKGYILTVGADDTEKLSSLIAPYICECMKYKLPEKYRSIRCVYEGLSFDSTASILPCSILGIEKISEEDAPKFVYDLTVEDNHNYFAKQVLVHNSSVTVFCKDGDVGVCSRNLRLPMNDGNKYVEAVKKYDLINKLSKFCKDRKCNIALQGELLGPGIQANKYKLKDYDIYFFNAFNIDTQHYFIESSLTQLCEYFGLKRVFYFDPIYFLKSADEWVEAAKGKSKLNPDIQREGIVVRLYEPHDWIPSRTNNGEEITIPNPIFSGSILHETTNYLSFKAINPNFLLKFDE